MISFDDLYTLCVPLFLPDDMLVAAMAFANLEITQNYPWYLLRAEHATLRAPWVHRTLLPILKSLRTILGIFFVQNMQLCEHPGFTARCCHGTQAGIGCMVMMKVTSGLNPRAWNSLSVPCRHQTLL